MGEVARKYVISFLFSHIQCKMLYFTEKKYVSPTGKALKDIGVLAALKINGVRVNSYTGDLERVQAPTVLGKRTRAEFYE